MNELIEGTCLSMCPERERYIREKEGLLHRFEVDERENVKEKEKEKERERVRESGKKRLPKADPAKTVKCFGRPAAGLVMTDPKQLRPAPVLLSTVRYLFTKVAPRTDVDWIVVYDFVFDRLRSVRQDAAIQRIDVSANIRILEGTVRFLVYSSQRLCERSDTEFNAKINDRHLAECVTHLLILYESEQVEEKQRWSKDRLQMEALYVLLNMGNAEVLARALRLPLDLRASTDLQLSMKISFACYANNYVRVCSLVPKLSPILVCAAMTAMPKLRRTALKIMSSSYNSKKLVFPGLKLQKLLLYREIDKVKADCELFGIEFVDENVAFRKANFREQVELARPEAYYTYQSMRNFLPDILLEAA